MKIYLTTDTHFGHTKIKEYCGRPDNFEDLILSNLSIIEDKDMLIHLGDFCFGKDSYWIEKFNKFKFTKVLVRGNHDHKTTNWYLEHGFDFVCEQFTLRFQNKNIVFSHEPKLYGGDINICGHFHNTMHHILVSENNIPIVKILSIENTNYNPVLLEEFLKIKEE